MNNLLPQRFGKTNPLTFLLYILLVWFVVSSFRASGLVGSDLHLMERLPVMWSFIKELFPPDFSRINSVSKALLLTFQMALAGTLIGLVLSVPLAILASKNFTLNRITYFLSRLIISLFRTVPDLIWALFFVITVGLGPLAGTLTLIIDTIGFCARFFAESIEETERGPIDGLTSLGASKPAIIFAGVFPAVLPSFTNTALFSLEKAVRASVVLGLVGAGGIGIELKVAMDTFRYAEASMIILAIFLMVIIVERVSGKIRSRLI